MNVITQLVDKSLVSAETLGGEVRYRMPETIRRYAQDRLVASGETAEVRTRHRTWYLHLAERAEARMQGPEETRWLDRLEVEHDNLRGALGWRTTEADDAETRVRLAAALYRFWNFHTHWGEGRKWLETALAGNRGSKSTARMRALYAEGLLAWRQGDYGRAMALHEESLALARNLGDQTGIARALFGRGFVTMQQGDSDAATALFEESLEVSRKLDDKALMAHALAQMGVVAQRKRDYAKSLALCEESLAMFRTLGTKRQIAFALRTTGHTVRLLGDLERAAGLYKESLALWGEARDKFVATECVEGLALIDSARGEHERAARLFGAAETARERFGITMPRPEAGDQEHFWAAIRERTEGTAFAAAWAEGRAMTLEQAIEYALEETE